MSETHFQTTTHDIVNLAAISLSAAPDLTEAERANRFQTVVRGIMEFQPADPAQTTIAGLIMGHHLEIMNGFRDLARPTLTPAEAARARTVTVSQTKVVLQLLRELRIERKEALTRAIEHGEPAREPMGDAAYEASPAKFLSTHTETLAMLENADPLTPAAAAKAHEALSQAMSPALFATPGHANLAPAPVTGSRARRRAMMKRNGGFKRHA
jgi:hypothetical protein